MDKRFVCLGMPSYGELTSGAARGFFRASRRADLTVQLLQQEGSLLAQNMNILWCWALNEALDGRCHYFAMLHADVEPEDFWLDALVAELDARDLDVLGAVVPIKDGRGVTSLALARPDGDPWRVHCRLTMTEVYRLPETFTSVDVGHPLLLNTGCWVARFDASWAARVRFTINDRIVRRPDGRYAPQVEPEDWYFSRLLHELGLRVGATRKVNLNHRGAAQFGNDRPWGQNPHDREYVDRSVLDFPKEPPMADAVFRHGDPVQIDYTPGSGNVSAGDVVLLGNTTGLTCGVAHSDIPNGALGAVAAGGGVYDVVNLNNAANFAKVYWDDGNNKVTTTSTNNAQFGYVVANGGGGANSVCRALHQPYA